MARVLPPPAASLSAAGAGLMGELGGRGLGLGPGAEFDLIRRFLRRPRPERADVRVGPGDDCAVVAGRGIALSSDLSVEGVHFRREWLSPEEIGWRAATAALSDLAAMAARPIGVLVSLAVPAADVAEVAERVMAGVDAAVDRVGGVVLGGDLTRSPGPLVADVTVVGEAPHPVLRSGARPGDEVWVTGMLGGAAAAVARLLRGEVPHPEARMRFAHPEARVGEALWLLEHGAPSAMVDLSDGLAGDVAHIAAASGVAVVLEPDRVPVHPAARTERSTADALDLALSGGEDYELCLVASPGRLEPLRERFAAQFGLALTRVGRVEEGTGVRSAGGDGAGTPLGGGYQHFRTDP